MAARRSWTWEGCPYAVSWWLMLIHTCHAMLCCAHAMLCHGLEKSLSEQHGRGVAGVQCGRGMTRVQHGHGMACVNQTQPHCVNQMGETRLNPFWHGMAGERQGRGMGTAWYVWISL
jgi:hypothetical protein